MLLPIIGLFIAAIAVAVVAWYVHYFKWSWRIKGAKGPTPFPFIGNALELRGRKTLLSDFSRLFEQYGSMVKLMLGIRSYILVADYEVFESFLSSTQFLEKSDIYKYLSNWLNTGLLLSTGAKWKKRRRILTPAFHFNILEQFVPIFDRVSNILVDQIRKHKNIDAIDIYPLITLSTLDVMCETAMGVSIDAQLNQHSEYVKSVETMGKIVIDRLIRPLEQSNWTYWLTENYRTEKKCLKVLHSHTKSVIVKRRQELQLKRMDDEHDEDDVGIKKRVAFLDLLLQATDNGVPLTDEDIQEEVDTFMFEGHDTTASGISFTLYLIATNSDVQAKVVAEQDEIFAGDLRELTYNDLQNMRYLEMVIKETLRVCPSVPFYARQHTADIQLANGAIIPAGTEILLIAHEIQRNPKFFPNPEKFDPDRFLPENSLHKQPYSFIPFSAGPRNCIGQKFAILEMKSTISKIIRHFELSPTIPPHQLDLTMDTILKSDNGIIIKMRERK